MTAPTQQIHGKGFPQKETIGGFAVFSQLNAFNWQFKNYGVDVDAFVAEMSATATAAALPPTATPTPVAP